LATLAHNNVGNPFTLQSRSCNNIGSLLTLLHCAKHDAKSFAELLLVPKIKHEPIIYLPSGPSFLAVKGRKLRGHDCVD